MLLPLALLLDPSVAATEPPAPAAAGLPAPSMYSSPPLLSGIFMENGCNSDGNGDWSDGRWASELDAMGALGIETIVTICSAQRESDGGFATGTPYGCSITKSGQCRIEKQGTSAAKTDDSVRAPLWPGQPWGFCATPHTLRPRSVQLTRAVRACCCRRRRHELPGPGAPEHHR